MTRAVGALGALDDYGPTLGADRAQQICDSVLRQSDADQTEVAVTARRGEHTRFAGDRIHQPQDLTEWQVSIRAAVDGGSGRAMTTDLDDTADAVGRAVSAARQDARDRSVASADVAGAAPAPPGPPLWDPEVDGFDPAARAARAHTALRAAADAGGVAAGMFGRAVTEMAVATSAGRMRYGAATEAFGSLTVRCADGSSHWVDLDRRLATVDTVAAIERTVAAARATRGRTTLADGSYDVVLGPIAVGGMLESLAAYGFTGRQLAAGTGAVATRSGTAVASPLVTIADDATHRRGLPFGFDIEGTDRRRVLLLEDGVVRDAVTDRATAGRTGGVSTGHAHIAREESPGPVPANLVVAAGEESIGELVAGIERGVFVERFWYLRVVDPVRTTLTGVSRDAAWLIQDGRLSTPVAGARWTEDVFGVLSRVDGISREVAAQPLSNIWNGCITAPALRVRGFRFGPAPTGGGTS